MKKVIYSKEYLERGPVVLNDADLIKQMLHFIGVRITSGSQLRSCVSIRLSQFRIFLGNYTGKVKSRKLNILVHFWQSVASQKSESTIEMSKIPWSQNFSTNAWPYSQQVGRDPLLDCGYSLLDHQNLYYNIILVLNWLPNFVLWVVSYQRLRTIALNQCFATGGPQSLFYGPPNFSYFV